MNKHDFKKAWDELQDNTDGWGWYWLSYGEKCYAFATVTAFPLNENDKAPPSGGRLELHQDKDRVWVAEDGTEMLLDDWIASIERQNGDVICSFVAKAYADAQRRFSDESSK